MNSEQQAFLDAIKADSKDKSVHLAYADWLEERGLCGEARSILQSASQQINKVEDLKGRIITDVQAGSKEIVFTLDDGARYKMSHSQD